jgi:hypothetical protein
MPADQSCEWHLPAYIGRTNHRQAWHYWDGEHEGRCNNINAQSWAAAAINIVLDVATISLSL